MTLAHSVGTAPDTVHVPDDVSGLVLRHRFPSPDLVHAAAGLFTRLPSWDGAEGPRGRVIVSPGVVRVSRSDPAKVERAAERAIVRRRLDVEQGAIELLLPDLIEQARAAGDVRLVTSLQEIALLVDARGLGAEPRGTVTSWSRKSRARMTRTLAELDYSPLLGEEPRAMVTLTYPGDWQAVAPDAAICQAHVKELRKRFKRVWGRPMVGVWKREFQRRGAPHFHVLMVPPAGERNGQNFRRWLSVTWADIVGHPDPEERRRHVLAGTGVDYAEGLRASDPRRLAVYFSKHGSFSAKDYQNEAPAEWVAAGSVGRFWGYWGLSKCSAVVEVTPARALAAARTLRRYSRAQGGTATVEVWRHSSRRARDQVVDVDTGEVLAGRSGWHKRRSTVRVKRVRSDLGFLIVNDGPAFASQLARYLDQVE